ncbi:MAG: sulfotransferase family protein [Mesorhizobium sp.]|nr:MAG: sulfotransferase family protein [Mesorhizobium sp.]RWD54398.1 MAG: sulfotransferase family protein [Mesorhizobium sp.]
MSIKVIGTGFGRTGTDSMREALTILGFGPCHHMSEVMAKEEQKRLWRALAKGAAPDWKELFSGYNSCMDWPSAHYWPELIKAYPDARVILTWRSLESWWESFEKTILAGIGQIEDQDALGLTLIARQVFGGRPHDRAHAIAVYEANVEAVMAAVPRERLLVHRLGDGWQPLCAHLGVPVPDQAYPNRNNTKEFRSAFSLK